MTRIAVSLCLAFAVVGCTEQSPPADEGAGKSPRVQITPAAETPKAIPHLHEGNEGMITSITPKSPPVGKGQTHPFQVGHCGLRHTVDFDASFWDVDPESMTEEENSEFGVNSSSGTMTLVDENTATYRSSRGGGARLYRHLGKATFFGCA